MQALHVLLAQTSPVAVGCHPTQSGAHFGVKILNRKTRQKLARSRNGSQFSGLIGAVSQAAISGTCFNEIRHFERRRDAIRSPCEPNGRDLIGHNAKDKKPNSNEL